MSKAQCELRYQMEAYFQSMPEIDAKRLEDFVNDCEPGEDQCEVSVMDQADLPHINEEIKLSGFTVSLGDFHIMGLVHSVPAPSDVVRNCPLSDEVKGPLAGHQSFVLLTAFGPDNVAPVEKLIFLYKVGMGLCAQGALGLGCPHSGVCWNADLLLCLSEQTKTMESPDGKPVTIWHTLREAGEPDRLLVYYAVLPSNMLSPDAQGEMLLLTRGFSHLGFPDFMYLAKDEKDIRDMKEFLEAGYSYMIQTRPHMAAGHTIGGEGGGPIFRLSEPPATFNPPFETHNVLLITREEKKKKLFGIFG